jgi:predicted DNA-binding protein
MANAMRKTARTAPKVGRPPAGDGGERVKDYPQVSFRLPKGTRDTLMALSHVRQQPQWRLVMESIDCYLRDLPAQHRAQVLRMLGDKRSPAVRNRTRGLRSR